MTTQQNDDLEIMIRPWFGTPERDALVDRIYAISWFRRMLNCLMSLKKWRLARAYGAVAVNALHNGDDFLFHLALDRGDALWSEIHSAPL